MDGSGDPYAVLRVSPTADFAAIRSAYRRAALLAHPDKGGTAEMFRLVCSAFETLSRVRERAAFDRRRCSSSATAGATPACGRRPAGEAGVASPDGQGEIPRGGDGRQAKRRKRGPQGTSAGDEDELQGALERLRAALQASPPEQRATALDAFTTPVRRELLNFMEARREQAQAPKPAPGSVRAQDAATAPPTLDEAAPSSSSGSEGVTSEEEAPMLALQDEASAAGSGSEGEAAAAAGSAADQVPGPRRSLAGCIRKPRGGGSKYRVEMNLKVLDLDLISPGLNSLEDAVDRQIIFVEMRRAAIAAILEVGMGPKQQSERFAQLFQEISLAHGTSLEDVARVRMNMRATEFIGRERRITSWSMPMDSALGWWARLHSARDEGWPALRRAWVDLLLHQQQAKRQDGRRLKLPWDEEPQRFVDKVWAGAAPHRARVEARRLGTNGWRRGPQSLMPTAKEAKEKNVHKAEVGVLRALANQERRTRTEEMKAAATERRRMLELGKWLRQDRTFEEMLGGPPSHLRK